MITDYLHRVSKSLIETDCGALNAIADCIIHTKETGARIFTVGNGGSASTASHFCNDLVKGCRVDSRTGFKAQCLCDPMPVLTCLANDFSYDDVFAVQLRTYAQKGDLLVAYSGSGNSPNILRAAECAREMGLFVIGFSGRDGGKLKQLCDICVVAPTWSMEELEDMHLCYGHALVDHMRGQLADKWDIEVIRYPSATFHSVLFDFDGTISLLREGWQQVMIPYFCEVLAEADRGADKGEIDFTVTEFVDMLTGKQTIYQCMALDAEVQRRGGAAVDPYIYKVKYLRRLNGRIEGRLAALRSGVSKPDEFLVTGALEFLRTLSKNSDLTLYCASGTDEADVLSEARLLQVDGYFNGGIFGARDGALGDVKETVIRKIIDEKKLGGDGLLVIGDGYVEIQLAKEIGAFAIAAATDEVRRKGINTWKRKRLLAAGADAVIPDFAGAAHLSSFLGLE